MIKTLIYTVTGQRIEVTETAMLVAGTVNVYTARFAFDEAWDGLQRTAVFASSDNSTTITREQLLTDDACTVPWEVLVDGYYLRVGVYGTKADGTRLPTVWTDRRQYIWPGAGPTQEAADPSPTLVEQLMGRMGDLAALKTEDKSSLVAAINEVQETGGGGGTSDHSKLKNRDAAGQHPMSAITGLEKALEGKQPVGSYITEESDPTVPEWAKQPQKPAYTASEVGADPSGTATSQVAAHNTGTDTHSDIRALISGLTDRLNALADSDDTTLDQLSEVVAYIKSNRSLIDAVTTSKVNVADIVDNLTTNVANKPLSAAQGVALKALIDAITIPDKLPNPNALTFTGAVTGSYDGSEPMTINIPSGGGGGNWKQAGFVQSETDGETLEVSGLDTKSIRLVVCAAAYASDSNDKSAVIKINDAISLICTGFIKLTNIKVTVIEIHLIKTPIGNYIFAPNFPSMRTTDDTATSASYQVGNYSAWFLVRADTVEKIESISFKCGNGTLLTGSKLNVEVI